MAVRVVDLLEAVEVDRHQRQDGTGRGAARDRLGQVVVKAAVVAESRQVVRSRLLLELLDACVGAVSRRGVRQCRDEQQPAAGEHRDRDCGSLGEGEQLSLAPRGAASNLIVDRAHQREDHDDASAASAAIGAHQRIPRQGNVTPQGLFLFDSCPGANPPDRGFMSKTSVTLTSMTRRQAAGLAACAVAVLAASARAHAADPAPCVGAGVLATLAPGSSVPIVVGPSVDWRPTGRARRRTRFSIPATQLTLDHVDVGAAGCAAGAAAPGGTATRATVWRMLGNSVGADTLEADLVPGDR